MYALRIIWKRTRIVQEGSEQGHVTLFHPNSGAKGAVMGKLDGVRWKQWKAIYQTGGAADCAGKLGTIMSHDPPLLFDLSRDSAESKALDTSTEPYACCISTVLALSLCFCSVCLSTLRVCDGQVQVSSDDHCWPAQGANAQRQHHHAIDHRLQCLARR